MTDETKKPVLTEEKKASDDFKLVIAEPVAQLPATVPVAPANGGGLSYANAHEDERAKMDQVIASIDLTSPESVINLGAVQRAELADLADQVLNSLQPGVKLAFAAALKELIDLVKQNSISDIKNRISDGSFKKALKMLFNAVTGRDGKIEMGKQTIERFMTDISGTRKIIQETVDKLNAQKVELDKNYNRINQLGSAITHAAQEMRIVRAATAEYIRRVEAGQVTTLADLEAQAKTSGRADDTEKLQLAQANWNNLRVVDGDLLGSIAVYDMNVTNLAFTKQANLQNRLQTATALTTSIAEWKSQLALFGTVTTEAAAASFLGAVKELSKKSVETNTDLFDQLVDLTIQNAAKGNFTLRELVEAQSHMATKLETVGTSIDAEFSKLEADKIVLAKSTEEFRKRSQTAFSKGGHLGAQEAPKALPAPKP